LAKISFYAKNKSTIMQYGMFRKENCRVKIIKTFAKNGEGLLFLEGRKHAN